MRFNDCHPRDEERLTELLSWLDWYGDTTITRRTYVFEIRCRVPLLGNMIHFSLTDDYFYDIERYNRQHIKHMLETRIATEMAQALMENANEHKERSILHNRAHRIEFPNSQLSTKELQQMRQDLARLRRQQQSREEKIRVIRID